MAAPFRKVLIANRGEIAVRVIRACHEMGIRTVAVYSEADRDALHVRYAHEAYPVGPPPSSESYLRTDKILEVAERSGAEAIHPGYGFLSENAAFARACREAGVVFIGPPPEAMEAMGNKVRSRELMTKAGVAVVPGSPPLNNAKDAVAHAERIGYPVLLKASSGGGGKGMRVVRSSADLPSLLAQAQGEARSSFGDETVFLEKYIERPRHIEVQVMADTQGNCVHFGERECSIQRRHQKLIEESPSTIIDDATRATIGAMAVKAAKACGYVSAGTVEMLRGADGSFYFMEMNTRLQVEHPVTEMVYGVDLVKGMIDIAGGTKLPWTQDRIVARGHAIECRIIAEDPSRSFLPAPGTIRALRAPAGPGVRYDGGVYGGFTVSVHYDPLLAKLITWGGDRNEAAARMTRALDELRVDGVKTSIAFHRRVMTHPAFLAGDLHTGFLEEHPELLSPGTDPWLSEVAVLAAAIAHFRRLEQLSLRPPHAGVSGRASEWKRGARAGWRR
jgi:acetyl-CoA carboxylase biotin carboxylase subunit